MSKPVVITADSTVDLSQELIERYQIRILPGGINSVYRQYITERVKDKKIRPGHVFLTESGGVAPETVRELEDLVYTLTGCREVHHTMAGCTVSTHCGPKTLGVLFIEE